MFGRSARAASRAVEPLGRSWRRPGEARGDRSPRMRSARGPGGWRRTIIGRDCARRRRVRRDLRGVRWRGNLQRHRRGWSGPAEPPDHVATGALVLSRCRLPARSCAKNRPASSTTCSSPRASRRPLTVPTTLPGRRAAPPRDGPAHGPPKRRRSPADRAIKPASRGSRPKWMQRLPTPHARRSAAPSLAYFSVTNQFQLINQRILIILNSTRA
jgi:hypothetical protein